MANKRPARPGGRRFRRTGSREPMPTPSWSKLPRPLATDAQRNGSTGAAATGPLLFPLSSTSADELRRTAGRLADWVEAQLRTWRLSDLAYTLARRRAHRPVRTAVIASSRPELIEALREVADGDTPYESAVGQDDRGPVWVFSGQGSQWAGMGADLLATEPVFAATVAEVEPLIARESGFSVTEAMSAPEVVTGDRSGPADAVRHAGRAGGHDEVLRRAPGRGDRALPGRGRGRGCRRSAVAGRRGARHLPPLAADGPHRRLRGDGVGGTACPASAFRTDGSRHQRRRDRGGGLAAVHGDRRRARRRCASWSQQWEQRDVMAREVAIDVASHSPQVDPILDDLSEALARARPRAHRKSRSTRRRLFDPREQPVCDARYWVDNLRRTVRFAAAVQAAMEDGYRVFAELAPHPLLTHALEQNARSLDVPLAALAEHAARARAAARAAWLLGGSAQCGRRGRLLGALPGWAAGGCAAADVDSPQLLLTRDGQDTSPTHGGTHRLSASAVGRACAPARGAGAPRLAGRSRHRRRSLGWATIRSTMWLFFRGPPTARWRWRPRAPSWARLPRSATSASSRRCCSMSRPPIGASASLSSPGVLDFTVETNRGANKRGKLRQSYMPQPMSSHLRTTSSALLAAHPTS